MNTEIAVRQDTTALVTMIERVAANPDVDVSKLRELVDLQERMLKSQAETAFANDMADMQGELPSVVERGKAEVQGKTRYTYALWEDINEAIKPILRQYGFSLTFRTVQSEKGVDVTGVLRHRGGHKEETTVPVAPDTSGNKPEIQALASAISYGKRYCAGALLNLTSHGEDDDAFAASLTVIDQVQEDEIERLLRDTKSDRTKFLAWIGAETVDTIPAKKYQQAVTQLRRKLQTSPPSAPPASSVASAPVDPDAASSGPPGAGEEGGGVQSAPSPADTRPITKEQHKRLEARINEIPGLNREAIKKWISMKWGINHFPDLTRDQYQELDAYLNEVAADLPE